MSDVVAVLVVPQAGDPGSLLEPGWCGGRPPMVVDSDRHPDDGGGWQAALGGRHLFGTLALPLWWSGHLVEDGWDRARRAVLRRPSDGEPGWLRGFLATSEPAVLGTVAHVGDWMVECGLAARVIRLVRVDGRLVELEPVGVGT